MKVAANATSARVRRLGLTLMELVVVMTILVALGGIVMNLLPNFLTKAHDSVTVTNIQEVNKAISGFLNTNLTYPNNFDSIINSSGAIYSKAVFSASSSFSLQNGGSQATYVGQPIFVATQLTGSQSQSLSAGGITALYTMQDPPSADGATFGAYALPLTTTTITANTTVMKVSTTAAPYMLQVAHIQPPINTSLVQGTDYDYVVFGLGQYCTIVGAPGFGIFECPVSFGEHSYEQPQNAYARMLCIFRVYNSGQRCEFLGSAHPDPTGFGTAAMHTEEFYQTN